VIESAEDLYLEKINNEFIKPFQTRAPTIDDETISEVSFPFKAFHLRWEAST